MTVLVVDALNFWIQHSAVYPRPTSVAMDLTSAPASQADFLSMQNADRWS